MKVLLASCIPFWDPWKEGGGVAVYVNNLVPALISRGYNVSFLSYGFKINPLRHDPYIKKSRNPYTSIGCSSYDLINSPTPAPVRAYTNNPQLAITSQPKLEQCIVDFVKEQGGYDVIHFHSLEGITPQVLKALKQAYPQTRIFYSAHDYHPFCIGIRLYQEKLQCACECYNEGQACLGCIPEFNIRMLTRFVRHYYKDPLNKVWLPGFVRKILIRRNARKNYGRIHRTQAIASDYKAYRKKFVEYINHYIDGVLAVSRRVGQIYTNMGICAHLIRTCYIGTKVADYQVGYQRNTPIMPLNVLFLGSATAPEKGFSFLLHALKQIPQEMAAKLNFIIAARGADTNQLKECLRYFNSYKVYDGYNHSQLQEIMQPVHLGIVPVLWEDNLPQIAIEMVAHGVPILCSDKGGASELCSSPVFKFVAGNTVDFLEKLMNIINHPELLQQYWDNHVGLTTMQQHVDQLGFIYQQK